MINTSAQDHPCVQNYDGSSGGMESEGLLLLMKQLQDKANGEIYLDYVITDDDTKMKKIISHPEYKDRGWKNHDGSLPLDTPAPNWFADPTGAFFKMTKGPMSDTRATKLDALWMKKYYLYFMKQNCRKDIKWRIGHAMAPYQPSF